jgi:hypothetical protein
MCYANTFLGHYLHLGIHLQVQKTPDQLQSLNHWVSDFWCSLKLSWYVCIGLGTRNFVTLLNCLDYTVAEQVVHTRPAILPSCPAFICFPNTVIWFYSPPNLTIYTHNLWNILQNFRTVSIFVYLTLPLIRPISNMSYLKKQHMKFMQMKLALINQIHKFGAVHNIE